MLDSYVWHKGGDSPFPDWVNWAMNTSHSHFTITLPLKNNHRPCPSTGDVTTWAILEKDDGAFQQLGQCWYHTQD